MSYMYMQMMAAEMDRTVKIQRAERLARLGLPEWKLSEAVAGTLAWLGRLAGRRRGADGAAAATPATPTAATLRCARARQLVVEHAPRDARRGQARFGACGARDLYRRIRRAASRL